MNANVETEKEELKIEDFSPVLQAQIEITSLFKKMDQTLIELGNMKAQLNNMDATIDAQVHYLEEIKNKIEKALEPTGDLF